MKIVGARPKGWWKIAKLARGDYCVADFYQLDYKKMSMRGKVYIITPFPAYEVHTHYYAVDDVKRMLQSAMMTSDVAEHELGGNVIGFTARNERLDLEATAPVFDSLAEVGLAYELLRLAGFNVQKPEAIWRGMLASMPPWMKLMGDEDYQRAKEDLEYHYRQMLRAAAMIGKYEARARTHKTKDIEVQIDMLREEPLIEEVELKPYTLIVRTKPITVSDGAYEWTNSYEVELDMTRVDDGWRAIRIRGEKVVDDLYHPHIKGDNICASAIGDAVKELANGRIYNAVMITLNILQSYDPEHMPFATIQHMVERLRQLEEAVER